MSTKASNWEKKPELSGITENAILTEIQQCRDGVLSAFQQKGSIIYAKK